MNTNDNHTQEQSATFQDGQPLGEILVEAGLITPYQIEIALTEQLKNNLRIGKILANHGWIKQQTADFFAEQWSKIKESKPEKPLVFYLVESGLINVQQVNNLFKKSKNSPNQKGFYTLVVEEGYLKNITIEYFLTNLSNTSSPKIYCFTKPYEIIKSYIQGETNFRRSYLIKARLKGLTLRSVHLDGSDLRYADLRSCNLSFSSLIQAKLNGANLQKAVLFESDFRQSCLQQANFQESCLEKVNFQGANLKWVDFSDAYLLKASFFDADLRGAKLPSNYSYDVYYNSQTRFDDNFNPMAAGWIKK